MTSNKIPGYARDKWLDFPLNRTSDRSQTARPTATLQ